MMTKQELQSGLPFTIDRYIVNHMVYNLEKTPDGDYVLSSGFVNLQNVFVVTRYEGRVTKFGSKMFEIITFVLDKEVKTKIKYEECLPEKVGV